MPIIHGFWPTVLFGILGGLLAELLRVAESLKKNSKPTALELCGSLLYIAMGGFVFLLGWNQPQKMIAVCAMGAAFPFTFAAAMRAAASSSREAASDRARHPLAGDAFHHGSRRSWSDYMKSQF